MIDKINLIVFFSNVFYRIMCSLYTDLIDEHNIGFYFIANCFRLVILAFF